MYAELAAWRTPFIRRCVLKRLIVLFLPPFSLPCRRLMWAVFDHSDSDVSLYLSRLPPNNHTRAPPPADTAGHPIGPIPATATTATAAGVPASGGGGGSSAVPVEWEVVVEGVGGVAAGAAPGARFHGACGCGYCRVGNTDWWHGYVKGDDVHCCNQCVTVLLWVLDLVRPCGMSDVDSVRYL